MGILGRWIAEGLTWLATEELYKLANHFIHGANLFIDIFGDALKMIISLLPGGSLATFWIDILDLILSLFDATATMTSTQFDWIFENILALAHIPLNFYYAFDTGVQSEAFSYLMSCAESNFWCQMLAGVQLVNQTVGHTILYPMVIVGIIVMTIVIFWDNIWEMLRFNVR